MSSVIRGSDNFNSEVGQKGAAKAWLQHDLNTDVTVDSYNVSSVIDDGTGIRTVVFATPMPHAEYGVTSGFIRNGGTTTSQGVVALPYTSPPIAESFQIIGFNNADGVTDSIKITAAVYE